MKKETKSSIKIAVIAVIVMAAVLFGLYKYQSANKKAHSHGHGEVHSH